MEFKFGLAFKLVFSKMYHTSVFGKISYCTCMKLQLSHLHVELEKLSASE